MGVGSGCTGGTGGIGWGIGGLGAIGGVGGGGMRVGCFSNGCARYGTAKESLANGITRRSAACNLERCVFMGSSTSIASNGLRGCEYFCTGFGRWAHAGFFLQAFRIGGATLQRFENSTHSVVASESRVRLRRALAEVANMHVVIEPPPVPRWF